MVTARKDLLTTSASGVENSIARTGARLGGWLMLWLRGLNSRHELSRLSDRALADIGTTRADISRFVKQTDPWRRLPGDAVFVLALGRLIERIEGWHDRRRRQAQVYRELMRYSDQELDDLGLRRRDIPRIARTA